MLEPYAIAQPQAQQIDPKSPVCLSLPADSFKGGTLPVVSLSYA
ncbi:MAG: hypothetical protein ACI8X5_003107 [Planctomycetota bacterium]|jgi:hypothetical protein